jgi:hypothetical protein
LPPERGLSLGNSSGWEALQVSLQRRPREDAERVVLWTQVLTGMERDEQDVLRPLGAAAWQQRCDRLAQLGGPPPP